MKLPAHVLFRKDLSLMLWKPHGILDEGIVNEIVAFIDLAEERASKPFNRFADLSALDMVDLNFKFVFHIALHRRLASASHSPVKSAFYVTSPATAHYAKVHAMLTDYSPLDVALFTEREAASATQKLKASKRIRRPSSMPHPRRLARALSQVPLGTPPNNRRGSFLGRDTVAKDRAIC